MREFNYELLKNEKWDSEIVGYISQIHEYKGRQCLYLELNPCELDRLIDIAKVQSTESSNAIEGIVTTNLRLKQLLQEKTAPRNRDEKEILGYRRTLELIHENYEYMPLSANLIRQLHKELYSFMPGSNGGNFKNTPNEIDEVLADGTRIVRFKPLEPYETPDAVERLCYSFNIALSKGEVDALILIPMFVHDFLCIHPFNDGNGRMSRLLTTLLLNKSGYVVGRYISLEKKINETKPEYYEALKESSIGWLEGENDASSFMKYLLGIILSAYREFEDRIAIVSGKKSSREIVLEAIDSKLGKFTKNDILELCSTIGKTSVETTLRELVESGKIAKEGKGKATFYYKK